MVLLCFNPSLTDEHPDDAFRSCMPVAFEFSSINQNNKIRAMRKFLFKRKSLLILGMLLSMIAFTQERLPVLSEQAKRNFDPSVRIPVKSGAEKIIQPAGK